MLMLAAVLLGLLSYNAMRKELNPEVSFGVVTVNTVYPGAGPEEVNELISRPIEEAVAGVNGIREVTSSSVEGFSTVVVQLELETNVDIALNDVRARVDGIVNRLPREAEKPSISRVDTSSTPVLVLGFSAANISSQELRDLIDDRIRDRYAQISGVASATVQGGDVREIQVRLKKDKLLEYGLGILDVQQQIAGATLNAPAGRLVQGDSEFSVRVPAEFKKVEDIKAMQLTIRDPNSREGRSNKVPLSEVADVNDTVVERTTYARLNGSDAILLSISKTREGNAIEITKLAEEITKKVETEFATEGIKIQKTLEEADEIQNSINDLNFDLGFAIFLVAAIVFAFLHNLRGTIIVALAIPTCICATYIVLRLMGYTINNLTMLALTLAVGVLVDDAIVVLENIYRHLKLGEDPREAALNGRGEIGLAAIAITLADVVVFLPIAFMPGITGRFLQPLAVGFVIAVLFSLFVSFTLTPMLASRWYKAGEDMEHPKGRFAQSFERGFGKLENVYRRILEWSLAHRWFVFILGNLALFGIITFIAGSFQASLQGAVMFTSPLLMASVVVGFIVMAVNFFRGYRSPKYLIAGVLFGLLFPASAATGYIYRQWKGEDVFKFAFIPDSDTGQVSINIELPTGTSLAATERVVAYVEEKARQFPDDVEYVLANVGTQGFNAFASGNTGSNYAQVTAVLYPKRSIKDRILGKDKKEKLRVRGQAAVAADLTQAIGRYPGADITVSVASAFFGSAIQMSFTSNDRQLLLETVQNIRNRLRDGAVPGVINPDISTKPGKPELQVIPDRTLLADAGISAAQLAGATRTLYQGDDTTKFRVGGKEYDIRVMMDLDDRNKPETLAGVPVAFDQGKPILLSSVATIQQSRAVDRIDRRDRVEEVQVTADLLPGYAAGSAQAAINGMIAREKLVPEGVSIRPLGQADAQAREGLFLFAALGIGLVLVYMLLASLYDNLLYPFIIQIAQPQAMVGALLALVLTDKSLTLIGMIGIITLVGLVGKNAILLVDYTNTLRDRGRARHDALVEAGPTRLRPIMMTTLALILGVLPIALAIGRGSEFRETIGITIIGGISLSTLLTLVVIPCSYTIFDDISSGFARLLGRRTKYDDIDSNGTGLPSAPAETPAAT
jgi:HAE1 family hydrophobic/amphiphilic exporter-1